ncbi:SGNH/GDSL hydrolase family protein [Spirosoma fluviale]|uniref:Lysophospholipase L1 n=1 Tax=Spirosoma fluviale TaxID=1597977 RepID=A0A286GN71_9BACT|nr:SGNH/GDSL hydrolase family protein [Spirosoma fluviale]SOD97001.1 Lysophospholipase L1 [Spirosoma fluviale]
MKKVTFLILIIAFVLSCTRTTVEPTPIAVNPPTTGGNGSPKPSTDTIVILGSSTAEGWGASEYKNSWAGTLARRLSTSRIVNLARGGYTSYQLLPTSASRPANRPDADTLRNITAALKEKPTLLIISISSNDAVAGYDVDEIIANFNTIRSGALAAGVASVLITTPIPRRFNEEVTTKLLRQRDLVMKNYAPFAINIFDPVANPDNLIKSELLSEDGIHPNDKGHAVIYKQIESFIL